METILRKLASARRIMLASLLAAAVAGCGGSEGARVSGKVTFADGSPLTKGTVVFSSGEFTARADIAKDGSYSLRAKPGAYKVFITGAVEESSGGQYMAPQKPLVDRKFTDPAASGLECDVKGSTTFDITVAKPAGM